MAKPSQSDINGVYSPFSLTRDQWVCCFAPLNHGFWNFSNIFYVFHLSLSFVRPAQVFAISKTTCLNINKHQQCKKMSHLLVTFHGCQTHNVNGAYSSIKYINADPLLGHDEGVHQGHIVHFDCQDVHWCRTFGQGQHKCFHTQKHVSKSPCHPYSHICLFATVDLGMTLLLGKLHSLCPSFFLCLLFVVWGDFSYQYYSSSDVCVERGEKNASSSVYPAIDLVIG